jgi:hypothetical protein
MEENDFFGIIQTLVDAGYISTGAMMYSATGLLPPRTIDDEWVS